VKGTRPSFAIGRAVVRMREISDGEPTLAASLNHQAKAPKLPTTWGSIDLLSQLFSNSFKEMI
jgi:hypothetical protein